MSFDLKKALGVGTDTIDRSVLGQPFLQIVQKGSPEFDDSHPEHSNKKIVGAKPGDIFCTVDRRILPQPVTVVPVAQATYYTEWKPRTAGGGFLGNHPLTVTGSQRYRKGQAGTPDENKEWLGENELKFTITFVVMYLDGEKWKRGILTFNSTQLKHARKWAKQILGLRYEQFPDAEPPIFAARWKLSTENDSNDKGGWKAWKIELDRMLSPEGDAALMTEAFDMHAKEAPQLLSVSAVKQLGGGEDVPY